MTTLRAHVPACLQSSHLGEALDEHSDRRFVGRDGERVIRTVARQGLAAVLKAQWVEGGSHGLELRQVWSVVEARGHVGATRLC
jgi:hypothetical protein